MKILLALIVTLICFQYAEAQRNKADSLHAELNSGKHDTNEVKILWNLAQTYQTFRPDSALIVAQKAVTLARKLKYLEGESRAINQIANAFNRVGNYSKALEYYIKKLKIEEQRQDPENMAIAQLNIATVFLFQQEYRMALDYAFIADSIIRTNKIERLKMYSLLNIGDIYEKYNKLDSAMEFTNRAYNVAVAMKDNNMIGCCLNNLGNICAKNGSNQLAIENYSEGLPYLELANDDEFICETSIGLANMFYKLKQSDSAVFYGRKAYLLSKADGFMSKNLDASSFMKNYFIAAGSIDSAFWYQEDILLIKDSINSYDKIKQTQLIAIDEQFRQKELNDLRVKEKEDLSKRLQFFAIGIFIPMFFIATLYMSQRRVKAKIVEVAGIISLLLLFEYITLLLHPVVVDFSNHTPIFELILFTLIAAGLTRVHHRIEKKVIARLSHKRKAIASPAIIKED